MKILIAGDVIPQKCNEKLFEDANIDELIGEDLKSIFEEADIRICNMEGPLTDSDSAIIKSGPHIKGSLKSLNGYRALFDIVSLANNHIMDYGVTGLQSTLEALDEAGMGHFGADYNEELAARPYICEFDGTKIGLYSCVEHEFSAAEAETPGANCFDALHVLDDIAELKERTDYVIVLYHGSKEHYRYPIPYVQKRCRRMVDKGADLVLCQHSHCIGCYESYRGGEILYGQGNFIFNKVDNEFRHSGLLVSLENDGGSWHVNHIPVVISGNGIRIPEEAERRAILEQLDNRSEKSKNSEFVWNEYKRFCESSLDNYYGHCLGRLNRIPSLLRKIGLSRIYETIFSKKKKTVLLNDIRCEAHMDLFATALAEKIRNQ